jgi:hypothetical protein
MIGFQNQIIAQTFNKTVSIVTVDQRKLVYKSVVNDVQLKSTNDNVQIVWLKDGVEQHLPTLPLKHTISGKMQIYTFTKNNIQHNLVVSFNGDELISALFTEYDLSFDERKTTKQVIFDKQ